MQLDSARVRIIGGTSSLVGLAAITSWLCTTMSTNIALEARNRLLQGHLLLEAINH